MLDKEIQRMADVIADGNCNLGAVLDKLKALIASMPYTLPDGAEYIPGYEPKEDDDASI